MSLESQFPIHENNPVKKHPPKMAVQLPDRWLIFARGTWFLMVILAIGFLISSLPGYRQIFSGELQPLSSVEYSSTTIKLLLNIIGTGASLTAAGISIGLSIFIYKNRFKNPAAMAISFYLLIYSAVMTGVMDIWGTFWFGKTEFVLSLQAILLGTPTIALFTLFPSGRFEPSWMRWVLIASIPWNFLILFIPPTADIFSNLTVTITLFSIWLIILPMLGVYGQVYRYRKVSTPDEQHQTKWLLYGLVLWISFIVLSTPFYLYLTNLSAGKPVPRWALFSELGWWISICIVPISFMIAITRYQLWNVDIVVNRTLVYSGLTALTIGFYIFAVGYLGKLLHDIDQSLIAFFATGVIAVLFQPLRKWLQMGVNRIMFGQRDDPNSVFMQLGKNLDNTGSPRDALTSIVETIAETLKLPYTAIVLGNSITSYGIKTTNTHKLPLKYQNETIGHLEVGQRSEGEIFSSTDLQLLNSIAHHAGAAAHAAKLTTDLRQSRQKLIKLREEERRRIRRDLHDGLGPTLASQTLKLDTVRNLLRDSPDDAEALIDELKKQTAETIQDVRRLVYDLRPPQLDQFGLVGAIKNLVHVNTPNNLEIKLVIPKDIPHLNAALEVAIFRTVQEGITNILNHAQAKSALIEIFQKQEKLIINIVDDGIGLPENIEPGIGLLSLQERADELDGQFKIIPSNRGLHLQIYFPLNIEKLP